MPVGFPVCVRHNDCRLRKTACSWSALSGGPEVGVWVHVCARVRVLIRMCASVCACVRMHVRCMRNVVMCFARKRWLIARTAPVSLPLDHFAHSRVCACGGGGGGGEQY